MDEHSDCAGGFYTVLRTCGALEPSPCDYIGYIFLSMAAMVPLTYCAVNAIPVLLRRDRRTIHDIVSGVYPVRPAVTPISAILTKRKPTGA